MINSHRWITARTNVLFSIALILSLAACRAVRNNPEPVHSTPLILSPQTSPSPNLPTITPRIAQTSLSATPGPLETEAWIGFQDASIQDMESRGGTLITATPCFQVGCAKLTLVLRINGPMTIYLEGPLKLEKSYEQNGTDTIDLIPGQYKFLATSKCSPLEKTLSIGSGETVIFRLTCESK